MSSLPFLFRGFYVTTTMVIVTMLELARRWL